MSKFSKEVREAFEALVGKTITRVDFVEAFGRQIVIHYDGGELRVAFGETTNVGAGSGTITEVYPPKQESPANTKPASTDAFVFKFYETEGTEALSAGGCRGEGWYWTRDRRDFHGPFPTSEDAQRDASEKPETPEPK